MSGGYYPERSRCRAHNPKVAGSNPAPATTRKPRHCLGFPIDFLGVNYYFRIVVSSEPQASRSSFDWRRKAWVGSEDVHPVEMEAQRTEMGWEIYPQGMTEVLTRVARDYSDLPIYITESGAAFTNPIDPDGTVHDTDRVEYMRSHLIAVRRAIDEGVDVRGYFAWSLLDNFEWTFGYSKRFGLVHVDFDTQLRRPIPDKRVPGHLEQRRRLQASARSGQPAWASPTERTALDLARRLGPFAPTRRRSWV